MGIISWIIVGLLVGLLARFLLPGRDPIGILGTIALGMVGALLGGWLWVELFGPNEGVSWIGSIIVSMALLWIVRRMSYRRTRVL